MSCPDRELTRRKYPRLARRSATSWPGQLALITARPASSADCWDPAELGPTRTWFGPGAGPFLPRVGRYALSRHRPAQAPARRLQPSSSPALLFELRSPASSLASDTQNPASPAVAECASPRTHRVSHNSQRARGAWLGSDKDRFDAEGCGQLIRALPSACWLRAAPNPARIGPDPFPALVSRSRRAPCVRFKAKGLFAANRPRFRQRRPRVSNPRQVAMA